MNSMNLGAVWYDHGERRQRNSKEMLPRQVAILVYYQDNKSPENTKLFVNHDFTLKQYL